MRVSYILGVLIIFILSSCATVYKNGYYQSRKYRSKTISFKNLSKIKDSKEERLSINFSKKVRNSTPLEEFQKPSEVDLNSRNDETVSVSTSEPLHIPKTIKQSKFQSDNAISTRTVSSNRTNRPLVNNTTRKYSHKKLEPIPNEKEGEPRFAKLALLASLLTLLGVPIRIFFGYSSFGYLVWGVLITIALVSAIINFFINKRVPKKDRYISVKVVNVLLLLTLISPLAIITFELIRLGYLF